MMFKDFAASDYAAWWGAIIATCVFLWDLFRWITSGPKIDLNVGTNMQVVSAHGTDGKTYITVRASNRGDCNVTVTSLCMTYYKGFFRHLRRLLNKKPDQSFIIAQPFTTTPIPFELTVGKIWDAHFYQTATIEKMVQKDLLYVDLFHSQSNKSVKKRIRIKKIEEK